MTTPELQLHTLFKLDARGRILSACEPGSPAGPLIFIGRSSAECATAVRADLPEPLARTLEALLQEEPPCADLKQPPIHASRYRDLISSSAATRRAPSVFFGPAFYFPEQLQPTPDVVEVQDEDQLTHHFAGWRAGEIAEGRAPVRAIVDPFPVSVCFSARLTEFAAEAGVETAPTFRRKGYATRTTAAWAHAIRETGRVPLYSTSWDNRGSLAIAQKLDLIPYASDWSLNLPA